MLAGCSAAQPTKRDADGNIIAANENASVFDMRVGDCYLESDFSADDEEITEVESIPAVPCSATHDLEVYAVKPIDRNEFPGEAKVTASTENYCIKKFKSFVGKSYRKSELDVYYFFPTSESWAQGDRDRTCLVFDPDKTTTGTLRNARR
mgnify:CR=1 FL=1